MRTEPRQSCTFRSGPGRRRSVAANHSRAAGPASRSRQCSDLEHANSASQDEDSEDTDFSAHWKSRLSAPHLQAQLSRMSDRTLLRRLKSTLLSTRAWQQVTRIEDLCPTHVSQVGLPLGRVFGKCSNAARLHHQRAEETW